LEVREANCKLFVEAFIIYDTLVIEWSI
jgi:hypothetical protein